MHDQDKQTFADIYRGVCATYGREANKDAMRIAWGVLKSFDIAQVQRAYSAHVTTSKFMPTPAEISDLITASNPAMCRPGADEAWAMMPRSEDDSVVWTEEMAYAWGIASSLVNEFNTIKPDWVAARMAFKDAYSRAVDGAKAQGRPVRWDIARGQRKDNLEDVLTDAIRLGRMSQDAARPHFLELEYVRPVNQQILLEGASKTKDEIRDAALQAVTRIRGMLSQAKSMEALEESRQQARAHCEQEDLASIAAKSAAAN